MLYNCFLIWLGSNSRRLWHGRTYILDSWIVACSFIYTPRDTKKSLVQFQALLRSGQPNNFCIYTIYLKKLQDCAQLRQLQITISLFDNTFITFIASNSLQHHIHQCEHYCSSFILDKIHCIALHHYCIAIITWHSVNCIHYIAIIIVYSSHFIVTLHSVNNIPQHHFIALNMLH